MSTPSFDDLPPQLRAAVAAWTESDYLAFRQHWAGIWDDAKPTAPSLTLVQYAREVACDPLNAGLRAALQTLAEVNHERAASSLMNTQGKSVRQAANLMRGLLACISATVQFVDAKRQVTADVAKLLGNAAAAYSAAWPLSDQAVPLSENHFEGISPAGKLLGKAARHESFGDRSQLTASTWLILQRLLMVLLGESDAETPTPQVLRMLLYGSDGKGHVGPLSVRAFPEGQWGFYPDPVAFGVTVIDASMQSSLKLAWRACESSLLDKISRSQEPVSLRLEPGFPLWVHTLEGGSAGGLFACGMYAAATGKRLDVRRTTTCALVLAEGSPDDGPLDPEHIRLGPVGKVPAKLDAIKEAGLVEVILEQGQADAWNESHSTHSPPPRISGASTLAKLFDGLTGDAKYEDLLERYADIVSGQWDQIRDANPESRQALRDENDTHRFDCYVPPDYRIERPQYLTEKQMRPEPSADESDETAAEVQDASVPGIADERLHHLLRLLRTSTVWEDAPDWLRDAQQPGPRGLVVYDNAGSGKTVFTFRAAHVVATQAARKWFGDRAPLVVRIEGHWPQDHDVPRDTHERKFLSLRGVLEQAVLQEFRKIGHQQEPTTVKECVRYALDQRRVVVILDGFDQFDPADRKRVVDMLSGKQRDGDAVDGCSWIIASRVHTIDEHRNDLFDDRHWVPVRIDPFSHDQQDEYFRHPTRDGRDLSELWKQTIGITKATNEETEAAIRGRMDELLRLPMTLWYVRQLIELTPASQPLPIFCSLSDLSLTVSRRLLERALEKSAVAVEAALAEQGIRSPDLDDAGLLQLLEHVLTLIACELMLEENYNGQVDADSLSQFEKHCKNRWFRKLDMALEQPGLKRREMLDLDEELKQRQHHWKWAVAVLKTIELNHRSVTERYGKAGLAFRSRKIVEAHAARYLTKYATEWDVLGDEDVTPCAFDFTNDPQWKDCWQLAIEMPRHGEPKDPEKGLDEAVTLRSLSTLFRQPKQEIRPNELIYRAWHLFEFDDQLLRERQFLVGGQMVFGAELEPAERLRRGTELILPGADAVLEEFRKSSRDLVKEMQKNTVAQQRASTENHAAWLQKWQHADCQTKSMTFVQCPPQAWLKEFEAGKRNQDPCVNVMGGSVNDNEKPQHQVRVTPFQMLATPVTRGLYHHYDPAFQVSKRAANRLQLYASPPAEALGEAAVPDNYPIIATDWYGSWAFSRWLGPEYALATECQWEHACRGDTTTEYHVGDELDHSQANFRTTIAGDPRYPVNRYGLFDVHDNVLEWCHNWFNPNWYSDRYQKTEDDISSADDGPPVGSSRVLRGGAMRINCDPHTPALRAIGFPVDDYYVIGFRVVCRLSGREYSQSSSTTSD